MTKTFAASVTAPTVGRIVHYTEKAGDEPLAAIVVSVASPTCVNLHVFTDTAEGFKRRKAVEQGSDANPVGWIWPPRA